MGGSRKNIEQTDGHHPETTRSSFARLVTNENEVDALVTLFARIAVEEGWQPGGELTAYRHRSAYFCLHDSGLLVGGLQVVLPDEAGTLPCQKVWPEQEFTGKVGVAHVAMLALAQPARGKQDEVNGPSPFLFWLLCVEMWRWCRENNIGELWLEATPRTLRCYQRLGWPLMVCGPLREHWGEPCYLTVLDIDAVTKSVAAKAARSQAYRHILGLAHAAD